MKWPALRVVAVEALEDDVGSAVRSVMIRDEQRMAVLGSPDDAQPRVDRTVSDSELRALVTHGLWVRIAAPWQAERGKVTMVSAKSFCHHLRRAGGKLPPADHRLDGGQVVSYRSRTDVQSFRQAAARALVLHAATQIRRQDRQGAATTLDHARSVCDRGSASRIELYAAYRNAVEPAIWEAMRVDASAELNLTGRELERTLAETWATLLDAVRSRQRIIEKGPSQLQVDTRRGRGPARPRPAPQKVRTAA